MAIPVWHTELGEGPLVACAVHAGHALRPDVAALMALDEDQRRYEEDPFTDRWTSIAPTRFVGLRSRFELDLNRPREKAIYLRPADAWGLHVWESPPPPELVNDLLEAYDAFYAELRQVLETLIRLHGRVVVFDLHSYNHRRQGPAAPPDNPDANPDVNLGTGSMDRGRWRPVVERCLAELRSFAVPGRRLDVRENVRFRGGELPKWVHRNFPQTACALAVEVKKFFMDEWTGRPQDAILDAIHAALAQAARGVNDELEQWQSNRPNAKH